MKSGLRTPSHFQTEHRTATGSYAERLPDPVVSPPFLERVKIPEVSDSSWRARLWHANTDKTCPVFQGTVAGHPARIGRAVVRVHLA